MFAETSPKCLKMQRSNVRRRPGSRVGPEGGKYKFTKATPVVAEKKPKKQKER